MFNSIPERIKERMKLLEAIDTQDRIDGTPRQQRLRQIPPETGKFIALLAACAPDGVWLEIGTSAGYSTLWLALACLEIGRRVTTIEWLAEKALLARETISQTGLEDVVEVVAGDARALVKDYDRISFCFLDADKEMYAELYELVIPRMVTGGLLVADNALSHAQDLADMLQRAQNDERVSSMIVPIGKGELICRKR